MPSERHQASSAAQIRELEDALRLAVRAFAQYALDTNNPPEQAVDDFVEGFLQDARFQAALR